MGMHELIQDITFSIVTAWILGVCAQFFRQPPILAYLAGGFLLGPSGLYLVRSEESIHVISELGLILMLFMIGLEIDLKKIVRAGSVIIGASVVQIAGTCILGVAFFWLVLPLGAGRWDPLYLGIAAALSSTVIIVKVLYEKRELDTLPGPAKVPALRDFFIPLFFVALGMSIPLPPPSIVSLALLIVAFLLFSRIVTVFLPLYLMRQGLRASLLPAINLSQMSEFSLVLIQVGVLANQTSTPVASAASLAFVILAVLTTFAMMQCDAMTRSLIGPPNPSS